MSNYQSFTVTDWLSPIFLYANIDTKMLNVTRLTDIGITLSETYLNEECYIGSSFLDV